MKDIQRRLAKIAAWRDVPVVFQGETGVGKEVVARELHARSPRGGKPFVKLNCAAVPSELLESELFGYERGAFTGAAKTTLGKFEVADGGTVLLDEIGDMDLKLQAKLLHVLQDWEFYRLGGQEPVRVNVRVLSATHQDLEEAVRQRRFREDLYYRLNVINIRIPPLRERIDEILPLARLFLQKHQNPGMTVPEITPGLEEVLLAHAWPGNVRELENVIRRLLVLGDPEPVAHELWRKAESRGCSHDLAEDWKHVSDLPNLDEVSAAQRRAEAETILAALSRTRWNRRKAAAILNVEYKVLLYKMKKLGIEPVYEGRIAFEPVPAEVVV